MAFTLLAENDIDVMHGVRLHDAYWVNCGLAGNCIKLRAEKFNYYIDNDSQNLPASADCRVKVGFLRNSQLDPLPRLHACYLPPVPFLI